MEDKKMKVLKGQIPVSILYIALGSVPGPDACGNGKCAV